MSRMRNLKRFVRTGTIRTRCVADLVSYLGTDWMAFEGVVSTIDKFGKYGTLESLVGELPLRGMKKMSYASCLQDIITVSPDTLPGYEEKIKSFYEEHIHQDEEIRYFLEGSGRNFCMHWMKQVG